MKEMLVRRWVEMIRARCGEKVRRHQRGVPVCPVKIAGDRRYCERFSGYHRAIFVCSNRPANEHCLVICSLQREIQHPSGESFPFLYCC